jgi:hypothetical protein
MWLYYLAYLLLLLPVMYQIGIVLGLLGLIFGPVNSFDEKVLAYLRKKGFKLIELTLHEEHSRLSSDASLSRL